MQFTIRHSLITNHKSQFPSSPVFLLMREKLR